MQGKTKIIAYTYLYQDDQTKIIIVYVPIFEKLQNRRVFKFRYLLPYFTRRNDNLVTRSIVDCIGQSLFQQNIGMTFEKIQLYTLACNRHPSLSLYVKIVRFMCCRVDTIFKKMNNINSNICNRIAQVFFHLHHTRHFLC